jgi:hypothetical protein
MAHELIFYQFSRPAIQEGDFSDFLSRFGPERLPNGRRLTGMMNGLATFVNGYDHDIRELYAIPEVRTFYNRLVQVWPYWLFFGNLDTDGLWTVVMCCMGSLDAVAMKGQSHSRIAYDPMELAGFVSRHFEPMNQMCERAGLSEQAIFERTKHVFEYFRLPL